MGRKKKSTAYQVAVGGVTGIIRLLIYAAVFLAIAYTGKEAYRFGYAIFNQMPVAQEEEAGEDVTVVIKEGQSAKEIGKVLKKKGLIEDSGVFVVQELLSNYHKKLLPGTYILNTSQTADEMMAVMAQEDTTGQPGRKEEKEVIVDERMVTYINSLDTGHTPFLEELERQAKEDYVPVIRREMQSFLKVFLAVQRPQRILEVGTAVGFSTLLMAEYNPVPCTITTIENYEKRIPIARSNFEKAGRQEQITLLEGDAADILKELHGTYDLIFMDAAKGQYIHFLPEVLRLLAPGGVLISDNVLQDGDIIESRFLVERRNRTIHKRMREYLYTLKHHEELVTSVIPLGDGITISVRRTT